MIPLFWLVTWQPMANDPGGYLDFPERSKARGFLMMRRAMGFIADIRPMWKGLQ